MPRISEATREKNRIRERARYKANPEAGRAAVKARREANLEAYRDRDKERYKNNPARRAEQHRQNLRRYKLTPAEYERMLLDQNGCCAICGGPEVYIDKYSGKPRRLSIDHCHMSGVVRGLLCHACNSVLGHAKDDVAILELAIKYLSTR